MSFTLTASAAALSILGINLGEPLAVPECEFKKQERWEVRRGVAPRYVIHPDSVCHKVRRPNETVAVAFPISARLPLVNRNSLVVQLVNQKVEYIGLHTRGTVWQQRDLETLAAKFGDPAKLEKVPLQNGFGAESIGIKASWTFLEGYQASFKSYGGRDGQGYFWIGKPSAKEAYEAPVRALLKPDREL